MLVGELRELRAVRDDCQVIVNDFFSVRERGIWNICSWSVSGRIFPVLCHTPTRQKETFEGKKGARTRGRTKHLVLAAKLIQLVFAGARLRRIFKMAFHMCTTRFLMSHPQNPLSLVEQTFRPGKTVVQTYKHLTNFFAPKIPTELFTAISLLPLIYDVPRA